MKKYVWLDLEKGEFSNSWDDVTLELTNSKIEDIIPKGETKYKLIKFECLNDKEFEFTQHMKLR